MCRAPLIAALLCACTPATRALDQYVAGAVDAIEQTAPQRMPDIYVSWKEDAPMGQCRTVEGVPVVFIYPRVIMRGARTVQEGRRLLTDVLAHELAHAALSCTDKDHEVIR